MSSRSYLESRVLELESENAQLRKGLERLGTSLTKDSNDKVGEAGFTDSQLHQREYSHRFMLNNMPAMIGYWDKQLRNRFSNKAYSTWFGVSPEQLLGKHIRELLGEKIFYLNLPYIEAALRGQQQEFERTIPVPDGSEVRYSLAEYIPDIIDGEAQGFFVQVSDITAVKQAEYALRESEERYRRVVQDQTELISRMRGDGTYIFVNEVFLRFFGKSEREIIGFKWNPLVYHEDLALVTKELARLSPVNPVVMIENRVYSGDGQVHWMQFSNRGTFDADGKLIEIQSVGRNISERKQAEAALHDKEFLLSESQRIGHIGSWHYNLETGELIWSEEMHRIYGVSPDTFVPSIESFITLIHLDDRQAMQAWITACAAGSKPGMLEFRINMLDGKTRILSGYGELQFDLDNKPSNLVGIVHDITERKQAEVEHRIAALAFKSQEGMFVTDADAVILLVNPAFIEITGYTAEEAVGQTPSLLKSDRHDAVFYETMWESVGRNGLWQGEIWNRRKNGVIYPGILTITEMKDDSGNPANYVATMIDITSRKAAEEQIHNLAFYDALTKLPNRRLLNDRLTQAMAVSKRSGRYCALMFLDLDNFKPINDAHGHAVGDLLLIEVTHRISRCVRETDTVARFGGDEFVVMLRELDEDKTESTAKACIVAEKIRTALARAYLLSTLKENKEERIVEHYCSSSIGIVLFINHEASAEDIIKWADMAMYKAKNDGRNLIRFHNAED